MTSRGYCLLKCQDNSTLNDQPAAESNAMVKPCKSLNGFIVKVAWNRMLSEQGYCLLNCRDNSTLNDQPAAESNAMVKPCKWFRSQGRVEQNFL